MSLAEPDGFREFVVTRSPRLVHTAYLLTGDTHLARDLVQAALARTWPHWERVRDGNPEAYVRTVMMRLNASWWRRRWRGEVPTDVLPEPGAAAGGGMPFPTDALDGSTTGSRSRRRSRPCRPGSAGSSCCGMSRTCQSSRSPRSSGVPKGRSRVRRPAGWPS